MSFLSPLRELNHDQRHTVLASFLGWTLDAFDYFLLTLVIVGVAKEFHASEAQVTYGLFLTLAARPLGALVFGRLADRFGRRPILMIDVIMFSVFELASAFAPTLQVLLAFRLLFGIAMGGEWGIGASLAMESIPPKTRGLVSGLLQSGYPCGFFLAALANWLLIDHIGWRGLFFGAWSEKIGRRKAMIIAALLAIPVIPLWMHGGSLLLLAVGAFLIQVMVQGAWGVVPTHLNELAPEGMRGTLPGFAYQTGNLLAAVTANAQLWIARQHGGLAFAMSAWMAAVAVLLAFLAWVGPEARGARFGRSPPGTGE